MQKETRTVCYDEDLQIEAFGFEGIMQHFPKHFHDYYVIGFVERGRRKLTYCGNCFCVGAGDVLLFNPNENHGCEQIGDGALCYKAFNVKQNVMDALVKEITGKEFTAKFFTGVAHDGELFSGLKNLHDAIFSGTKEFFKEELLYMTFGRIIDKYTTPFKAGEVDCGDSIEKACSYMRRNFAQSITLDLLCRETSLSKATLVRAFAKRKGTSPYRYLQNIRLAEAKKLLESGVAPVDAAYDTGFADQSHFTNFFKDYIGLTPGQYREIFKAKKGGD